jgi:alpha-ketoglutaric semialdehyde dehydrogenase
MQIHGCNFIGTSLSAEGDDVLQAFSTITGSLLPDKYSIATESEIDRALSLAEETATIRISREQRSAFLQMAADKLLAMGDAILDLAHRETALPIDRLVAERMRTVNQLRIFASLVEEGSWVDARIDHADQNRKPLPKPDVRRMLTPIGPVAVFGASNFPFAYSVAGNDTSSAFAAGCPVIVKAHPAHPGTSELTAAALVEAIEETGMPEGIFSMLHGEVEVGQKLIMHPKLAAAGFTGSLKGGRALCDAAAARPVPIPVHAEMGSINPVFLLPNALEKSWKSIADGFAQSVTLGTGQFCVNPGLVAAVSSPSLNRFVERSSALIAEVPTFPMLTPGICKSYFNGIDRFGQSGAKSVVAPSSPYSNYYGAMFTTTSTAFLSTPEFAEEVFGPATLLVVCESLEDMLAVAHNIKGQLTGTVHADDADFERCGKIISAVTAKVGRVIFNSYPTSVEVVPSMQHGGPYPASSDSRFTSVGTAAIFRFARPICWQNAPQRALPLELRDNNPLKIRRIVDGALTCDPI